MASVHILGAPVPEEVLRLQGEGGVEFANGQIVEKPVSIDSSAIEAAIIILLGIEAAKNDSARVFPSSMGYQCFRDEPARFRKPDVSVVRVERLAGIDPREGFIPIPPDLAVEVMSPNDLAEDIAEKVDEYLKNNFAVVWVVQPRTRTVTIYRADGSVSSLHEQDEITGESFLPTFKCKVGDFFTFSQKPARS